MSKKDLNVILKNSFKDFKEFSEIYLKFEKNLKSITSKTFLIAVSGGPDSLALAALAKAYSYKNKAKINYVLIDHKLREESSNEANKVKKLLKKHKISLNILTNKKKIKKNIQGEARNIRYELLKNFCKKKRIKNIITAHHLDDQVETFFIRLSRGSGLEGLSSMRQKNFLTKDVKLIRPLLENKKTQLIKLSKKIFGKYFKDPTNDDQKFLRIRIRKLKKIIEKSGINYDQIFRSIQNLGSSRDTLNIFFDKIFKESVTKKNNNYLIRLSIFNDLNQEMQLKILQKSIKDLTKKYYFPRTKKIVNLINNIKLKKKMKSTLGGCIITKEKNNIMLIKEPKK